MLQYYRLLLLLWFPLLMISCKTQQLPSWTLVWSDEFDYEGLPDPKKWTYEIGHIRNQEKQYYTGPRIENVEAKKGKLFITGKKEQFPNAEYEEGSTNWRKSKPFAEYTSSCIITDGINAWRYGRIEISAKLPSGDGIWPAIWMLGEDFEDVGWPHAGEIDIMEHVGTEPNTVHGTVHYPVGDDEAYRSDGGQISKKRLSKKFHTYAIEWTEDRIDFFINEIKYHSFELDKAGVGAENPFRKPHYLLINLAMGAKWPGPIDDQVLPQQFIIDYVRVYQKNN